MAAKQDASGSVGGADKPRMTRNAEGRARPDKGELPGLGVGRRYLPVRQR